MKSVPQLILKLTHKAGDKSRLDVVETVSRGFGAGVLRCKPLVDCLNALSETAHNALGRGKR